MEEEHLYPNQLFSSIKKCDFLKIKHHIKKHPEMMNQQNVNGKTPLHVVTSLSNDAVHKKDKDALGFFQKLIRYMIRHGADPSIKDKKGFYVKYDKEPTKIVDQQHVLVPDKLSHYMENVLLNF